MCDEREGPAMSDYLNILLFEDDQDDALFIRETLERSGMEFRIEVVENPASFIEALDSGSFDLILSDNGIMGYSGLAALEAVRGKRPGGPLIAVSGLSAADLQARQLLEIGVPFVSKQNLNDLPNEIRKVLSDSKHKRSGIKFVPYNEAMDHLVEVVQAFSLARSLEAIMEIVRHAARDLTGADGATFVLRDGDRCYYAEEDAISPLWKGQRFPMSSCISGWAMLNRKAAVIPDIYSDERIPADAYRPTFVKSLVMVPIRTADPVGAIGNYWAETCRPPVEVVKVLQALADTTSVAMENMQLYQDLERRVKERTVELERSNRELQNANTRMQTINEELAFLNEELETFTGAVSHDLRAPLRKISTFAEMIEERCAENLDEKGSDYLRRIRSSTDRMSDLIEDLLLLSRAVCAPVKREMIDLSSLAREVAADLPAFPESKAEFIIGDRITAEGDLGLLRTVLENLLSNALKFASKRAAAKIEFGVQKDNGRTVYFVRDNGAGFDMKQAERLFVPFQRLHAAVDFPGTGVGLATVQRIVRKHGGRIWAAAAVDAGATFYFTLE